MKKTFAIAVMVVAGALSSFGQGAIRFASIGSGSALTTPTTVNATVFNVDGTTPISGAGFSIQLFYGALGAADDALTPLAAPILNPLSGGSAGRFGSPTVQIPGFAVGSSVRLQVRAWDNQSGSVTSWDNALIRGQSLAFNSAPLGDNLNAGTIPVLQGLQSFSLTVVPEPSVIVLGLVGVGALMLRRRNNRKS